MHDLFFRRKYGIPAINWTESDDGERKSGGGEDEAVTSA